MTYSHFDQANGGSWVRDELAVCLAHYGASQTG